MKFITNTAEQTRSFAKKLAHELIESEKKRENALVVSLEGELGTGKTTFVQGFAIALGVERWIKSPTFVLMREHKLNFKPKTKSPKYFYHIDCYRLKNANALLEIGLKEILKNPKNIVLIEWGEKLKNLLPEKTIRIKFKHLDKNRREIVVK